MIKKNLKLELVTIGPDNVEEWIARFRGNRARSARHSGAFIRVIRKGYFRDGGLIFVDSKGKVQDAQHRLEALQKTGHTAKFWVLSGLDAEDLNSMLDSGKKRSNSTRLAAARIANATTVVAAIEEIIDTKEHWKQTADMLMFDEVQAFLEENRKRILTITKAWVEDPIADVKTAYLVAFYFLFGEINEEKNDLFFNALRDKANQKPGHPVRAFHEMLQTETVRKAVEDNKTAAYNRFVRNGLIIAWNHFLKGETIDHLVPTKNPVTLDGTPTAVPESEENGNGEAEVDSTADEAAHQDETSSEE